MTLPETRVICINQMTKAQVDEFIGGDSRYEYIGRAMVLHGVKLKASQWANKHDGEIDKICKQRKCGVREAIQIATELYKADVQANRKLLGNLPKLRGKILVCFWVEQGNALIELLGSL